MAKEFRLETKFCKCKQKIMKEGIAERQLKKEVTDENKY